MIRCVRDLGKEIAGKYQPENLRAAVYNFPGVKVELKSNSPSLISLLDQIYGGFRADGAGESAMYLLEERGGSEIRFLAVDPGFNSFICSDPGQAVSFWGSQLMVNHLYRSHFLFLHSSVLGRDGFVYLFPGGSRSGKTTLALRLGRTDHIYFSEELAPLEVETGKVYPFPRSFLLRKDSLHLVPGGLREAEKLPFFYDHQEKSPADGKPPKRFVLAPGRVFSRIGGKAARVGGIFFLSGFSGGVTRLRPLPAALALEQLVEHSVNPGYLDSEGRVVALETLLSLVGESPAFSVELGGWGEEPEALSRALEEAMEGERPRETEDLKLVARRCREIMETWKYKNIETSK